MNPCTNSPLVSAFHDGELDATRRDALASHLAGCDDCQAELARLAEVTAALRGLRAPVLAAEGLAGIHRRLDWSVGPATLNRWARRMALAACVLLMVSIGFYVTERGQKSSGSPGQLTASASWEQAAVTPVSSTSSTSLAPEAETAQWIVASLDASPQ